MVEPGRFVVAQVPDPKPADGEVLVAMELASICGSDLHVVFEGAYPGPFPTPVGWPGHEGLGIVVESRSPSVPVGTHVLTVPMPGMGGCFAELLVLKDAFVVPIPAGDGDRLVLAQQLGTAVFGFHRYWPDDRDATGRNAAIIGAGSAGLFLLQLVRRAGFERVFVTDLDPRRLAVATALGADRVVDPASEDFVEVVIAGTDGGADLVIEAAGPDACRAQAVEVAKKGGRLGCFGLPEHPGLVPFPFHNAFRRALTIEMAGNAQLEPSLTSFRESVALISSGAIDVAPMLGPRFALDEIGAALDAARDHLGVKISVDVTT
jgi:threonine dehydrogenase-like Zn-dependent dehydrogenase